MHLLLKKEEVVERLLCSLSLDPFHHPIFMCLPQRNLEQVAKKCLFLTFFLQETFKTVFALILLLFALFIQIVYLKTKPQS
jgi:hypothetical protein